MDIPVKGVIIDRVRLLEDMRASSGAETICDSVIDVSRCDEGYTVRCTGGEFSCRYLVGADGGFSIVRKRFFVSTVGLRSAVVNNLVKGDSDTDVLEFQVSTKYPGAYRWDFPSKDGFRSIGYEIGTDDIPEADESGFRYIVCGRADAIADGNCCLVGDAALMNNPICYSGIGAALLSGKKAAESIAEDNLAHYAKWKNGNILFDRHFMEAAVTFRAWGEEEYADAVKPFRKGYSVWRGVYAVLRRPKWANIYISIWQAFRKCW